MSLFAALRSAEGMPVENEHRDYERRALVELNLAVTPASLRKQVEDKLRQAIVTGHFRPGDHLPDRVLCETFQVSRTVVREAVRQLEAEGLIETLSHKGSFVRAMSVREAEQIYDVRAVLEALAAKSFARNATEAQIAELRAVFEEFEKVPKAKTAVNVLDIKQRFYEILLRGCGNEYVTRMLNQILNRNTLLRATSLSDPKRLPKSIKELRRLIQAIEARDAEEAWAASFEHVHAAAQVAIGVLARQHERG